MKSRTVYAFCKKWYWFAFWQHWLIFQSWPLAIYYSCNYSYWILQKQLFKMARRYIQVTWPAGTSRICDATRKSDRFDTNLLHLGSPYLTRIFIKTGRVSNLANQGFEEFSKIFSQNSLKSMNFGRLWYPTTPKMMSFRWFLTEINDFSEILIPYYPQNGMPLFNLILDLKSLPHLNPRFQESPAPKSTVFRSLPHLKFTNRDGNRIWIHLSIRQRIWRLPEPWNNSILSLNSCFGRIQSEKLHRVGYGSRSTFEN